MLKLEYLHCSHMPRRKRTATARANSLDKRYMHSSKLHMPLPFCRNGNLSFFGDSSWRWPLIIDCTTRVDSVALVRLRVPFTIEDMSEVASTIGTSSLCHAPASTQHYMCLIT
mmetsp:Transcript_79273/g.137445  ORF Transcript_79273/g.137445 Transcript_79273/m.137445 type:complete len:113 (+) Transcript_79273:111-449(+)